MRAVRVTEFGGPQVLKVDKNVPVPKPSNDQVRHSDVGKCGNEVFTMRMRKLTSFGYLIFIRPHQGDLEVLYYTPMSCLTVRHKASIFKLFKRPKTYINHIETIDLPVTGLNSTYGL
jgi:hypothetical protein